MNILIADKADPFLIKNLTKSSHLVDYQPLLTQEELILALQNSNTEILIVRSTQVTKEAIQGAKSLKWIIRAGAGTDNINIDAAKKSNISVSNCPGTNSRAVAELTIGLIISIDRKIPDNVISLREGKWNKKRFSNALGLYGKRLGLIGYGNISKLVASTAQTLGMKISVYSSHCNQQELKSQNIDLQSNLSVLASECDIISIHCSSRKDTIGLIDKTFFEHMKENAYIINTSRKEIINQTDLVHALKNKSIFAALDVFEGEEKTPEGEYHGELQHLPNVYCTHHIGASTQQAQEAVSEMIYDMIQTYDKTGKKHYVIG